jgi:hypothetical protein
LAREHNQDKSTNSRKQNVLGCDMEEKEFTEHSRKSEKA